MPAQSPTARNGGRCHCISGDGSTELIINRRAQFGMAFGATNRVPPAIQPRLAQLSEGHAGSASNSISLGSVCQGGSGIISEYGLLSLLGFGGLG